ncbi:hypothetical protein CPAR01_04984 [Colletotrichum paranaense]|uniref:Uncharacterized protein n=2 Tax=Colletotrichum acutatum species complex TaxID=2707335 RepID=A0AAI9TXG6_9PEZI|nr:uncharacterized protein CPAR01_04984 [Colletotrichum paranaense]KAK1447767.1 hypothetical protein CMEL01_09606 [Colletotrichum melonis]KAK1544351.1 hypothetical protein CPAR01_04984 [Colletotrichum paranaense]
MSGVNDMAFPEAFRLVNSLKRSKKHRETKIYGRSRTIKQWMGTWARLLCTSYDDQCFIHIQHEKGKSCVDYTSIL